MFLGCRCLGLGCSTESVFVGVLWNVGFWLRDC